jgi:ATP-dependent 26S proteasome regulatory subunit
LQDIGGMDIQKQEIKEAVELPLTHPELYEDIGIKPPKGVILYGEPGTGKTLLAKAVANSTSASFLRVVGSELIQKYLGDGPKLVRELFRVAEELVRTAGLGLGASCAHTCAAEGMVAACGRLEPRLRRLGRAGD